MSCPKGAGKWNSLSSMNRTSPSHRLSTTRPGTWTSGWLTQNRPPSAPMPKPMRALVHAWIPSRPPPTASWSRPAAKPPRQPNSGPRLSASRTTTINGMSGTTSATRSAGARVAWAMPPPKTVNTRMPRMLAAARGGKVGGDVSGLAARHQQDFVDAGEVHNGFQDREVEEARRPLVQIAHPTDGHTPREQTALTRRHHEIADLKRAF